MLLCKKKRRTFRRAATPYSKIGAELMTSRSLQDIGGALDRCCDC
jgi:hypothetical protein